MPHLLRPQGPLPARIYWVRRLLLLGLVVVVVVLVWWLTGRGGSAGADPATAQTMSRQTPTPTSQAGPPSTTRTIQPTVTQKTPTTPGPTTPGPTTPGPTTSGPTTQRATSGAPDRKCEAAEVSLRLDVSDAASGDPNQVQFMLSSDQPCVLTITPARIAIKITSGSDTIWSGAQCPDDVPARRVVVGPEPRPAYTFTWDGHRSTDQCRRAGSVAKPGGYWVHAALIGGAPHKAYFDVTG